MDFKSNSIVIQAGWSIDKIGEDFYIPQTHYTYLSYICCKYKDVVLLSSTRCKSINDENKIIIKFSNLKIKQLPPYKSFSDAIKYASKFYRAIKELDNYELFYCRVPDPFSWMPKLFFSKKAIIHFVGDTIDATLNNQQWSLLRKMLMITGYLPEYILTIIAARKSIVYTNGYQLSKNLRKFGIEAKPVISSTLKESDFCTSFNQNYTDIVRFCYIGYLRYAKGINLLMELIIKLKNENVHFQFDIIGNGEMFIILKNFVKKNSLDNIVILHGHIDDSKIIQKILNSSDLFIFPSLSEGSPRVVLEAMAQGVPVISTPVGSLPYTFTDKEEIRFANYNDCNSFFEIVFQYMVEREQFWILRNNAYEKVLENYTRDKFLNQVFSYET